MLNAMLKLFHKITAPAVPVLDPLKAQITVASQRNDAAADRLREVMEEMLAENDRLRKKGRAHD